MESSTIEDKNLNEAPSFTSEFIKQYSFDSTECSSSSIEIISIDENKSSIDFKCYEENPNEKKNMSLKDFFEKKDIYCKKSIKEDKCPKHSLDSSDNNYISYCFDCKTHLCKECLKTRIHINHNKNYLIEIQPTQDELNLFDEVSKDYAICIENLKQEKKNTIEGLKRSLEINKNDENNKLKKKIGINKTKEKKELLMNDKNYLNDIEEIKKKYENEIKFRKDVYNLEKEEILRKYKLINEQNVIKNRINIENLIKKNDEIIENLPFDKKIKTLEYIIKLNRIVYNSYNNLINNYYNALNINNILFYFCNNDYIRNKIMKNVFKNNYDNIVKLILTKRTEDVNLNKKIENEKKKREKDMNEKIELKIKEVEEKNKRKINNLNENNKKAIKEMEIKNQQQISKIMKEKTQKIKEIQDKEEMSMNVLVKEVIHIFTNL